MKQKPTEHVHDYIIVGDNNFWYDTVDDLTKSEALKNLLEVKKQIKAKMYEDNSATFLRLYQVQEVKRILV